MEPKKMRMNPLIIVLLLAVGAPATTPTAPPTMEPKIELGFKLQQNFTSQLTNKSSPEFKQLDYNVTTALNKVYSVKFGAAFNRTVIKGFSQGSVVVEAVLIFNNGTTLPNASSVAKTLETASSSSNFSLSVNTSSITASGPVNVTTSPPVTTKPPAANTTAAPNATGATTEGTIGLKFSLNQTFTSDLANSSSPGFLNLSAEVVQELNKVGTREYGSSFLRSIVNGFTNGSVVVNATLVFKDKSSVPSASNATSQLSSALTSNSSLNVVSGSVNATSSSVATAAPSTTIASTDPPASSEGTLGLIFSLNQTFTPDLSNSSSAAFQTLAAKVVKELNRVATSLFGSCFRRSIVNTFTNGSGSVVVVNSTLVFKDKSSVPSASNATAQLISALINNSTLNIVPGSITTSPTSSSPPQPIMGSLVVFSLTLLAVAQMLIDL